MAALPDILVDRYKRYKTGSTKVVKWLVDAAQQCGDGSKILKSLKKAKAAAKRATEKQPGQATNDPIVQISTTRLLQLAEAVAASDTTIPQAIIHTLHAVIEGREKCLEFYSSLGETKQSETTSLGDAGHRYFIAILRQVLGLLEEAQSAQHAEKKSLNQEMTASSDEDAKLNNLFEYLQLEEPSNTALGSEAPSKEPLSIRVELETSDDEDTVFAAWCFLQDLHEVRQALKQIWYEHKHGSLTYETAAEATEASFAIVYCVERELVSQFKGLGGFITIARSLGVEISWKQWTAMVVPNSPGSGDRAKQANRSVPGHAIANLFMPLAVLCIKTFREAVVGSKKSGKLNCTIVDKAIFSSHPFGAKLYEFLPFVEMMATTPVRYCFDRFVSGLVSFYDATWSKALPSWMAFGCQVYMDIHDILGDTYETGHQSLLQRSQQRLKSLQIYRHRLGVAEAAGVKPLQSTEILMRSLTRDGIREAVLARNSNAVVEPYRLLQMFPVSAGQGTYIMAAMAHSAGLATITLDWTILAVAYLYRACKAASLIADTWVDMEFVIKARSETHPFVWSSDHDVEAFARHFGMALGVKRTGYDLKNPKVRPKLPSEKHMGKHFKVESSFPARKGFKQPPKNGLPDMDAGIFQAAAEAFTQRQVRLERSALASDVTRQWTQSGKVTPAQLVVGYKEACVEHEPDLNFDYLAFAVNTMQLVIDLVSDCTPIYTIHPPTCAPDWDCSALDLVYAILWDAGDGARNGTLRKCETLLKAARIIQNRIDEGGRAMFDQTMKVSSTQTQAQLDLDVGVRSGSMNRAEILRLERTLHHQTYANLTSWKKRLPAMFYKITYCNSVKEMEEKSSMSDAMTDSYLKQIDDGTQGLVEVRFTLGEIMQLYQCSIDDLVPLDTAILHWQFIDNCLLRVRKFGYGSVRWEIEFVLRTYTAEPCAFLLDKLAGMPSEKISEAEIARLRRVEAVPKLKIPVQNEWEDEASREVAEDEHYRQLDAFSQAAATGED